MSVLNVIGGAFKKLWKIITSPAAQRAIESAVDLVPTALPIVQELSVLDPKTATVADVIALYEKFKVAVVGGIQQNPVSIGNALLNLATAIIKEQRPSKRTSIIQSAVQLALMC